MRWIKIWDEAEYNLDEIMENYKCSEERAIEIAQEWFDERHHADEIIEVEEADE